ncbi:hypothetical protein B0H13DRAFT_2312220 [Mycena leptocephala]|nr:hypothetical protein B0H13DRAFT_2312220 [Mycena leptocephala]
MSLVQRAFREVIGYRLGYCPQHPYPWRWTTPVVLAVFLLLSGFLAALNVPLSAYNINQEFTYRPNDTLPPLLFSNMMPEILRSSNTGFTPQLMAVGATVQLNNSVFNYTIAEVFDEDGQPVSSFSYYNNPFSNGCDVTDMTANLVFPTNTIDLTVSVNCLIPASFTLTWSETPGSRNISVAASQPRDDFYDFVNDLTTGFAFWSPPIVGNVTGPSGVLNLTEQLNALRITVQPCFYPHPATVQSSSAGVVVTSLAPNTPSLPLDSWQPNSTNIFSGLPSDIQFYFGDDAPLSTFNLLFQNTFQSLYHSVRMELGVILENQIYASPEMYNDSISPVYDPSMPDFFPHANAASNTTLMLGWKESVRSFSDSDRVPVMLYPRLVPRLKPSGSAITSVFVATFAMLSALWTLFTIIAGALAGSHGDLQKLELDNKTMQHEMAAMHHTIARLEGAFGNAGLLKDIATVITSGVARGGEHKTDLQKLERDNKTMQHEMAAMHRTIARLERALGNAGLLKDIATVNTSEITRGDLQKLELDNETIQNEMAAMRCTIARPKLSLRNDGLLKDIATVIGARDMEYDGKESEPLLARRPNHPW